MYDHAQCKGSQEHERERDEGELWGHLTISPLPPGLPLLPGGP